LNISVGHSNSLISFMTVMLNLTPQNIVFLLTEL
jgi:hypothetical protein